MAKIHGAVTLVMPSGVTHTISNRLVLRLIEDVSRARKGDSGPMPESIYEQFAELAWFRDCASAYSSGGDHLFEIVFLLVRPAAATPTATPVEGESPLVQ